MSKSKRLKSFAFRFREPIFALFYLAGFWAPWLRSGGRTTLWLSTSAWIARAGWLTLGTATIAVTVLAFACLALGTLLRVGGTAYLGSSVMLGGTLRGDRMMTVGPYGFVRNPLYLGSWLIALGTSILMPASGALFFLAAFTSFAWCLILMEEQFLTSLPGEAYDEYRRQVPRVFPRFNSARTASASRPLWLHAAAAESFPVAFTACFAVFAWRYNAHILLECLLVSYGASLVVRASSVRS